MEKDNFYTQVNAERQRQDEKWGEQNHHPDKWMTILMEEVGELAKAILESSLTTYGEKSLVEHELIQVAAVAMAMWESGKRMGWLSTPNWDKQ